MSMAEIPSFEELNKKSYKTIDELVTEYFTMQDGVMAGCKLFTETEFREALAQHGIQEKK